MDDLDRTLTQDAKDAICDLVLAWAGFDTTVSYWMGLTFGLDIDIASILIGNMDTRTKLDRMKLVYDHLGAPQASASIGRLVKAHGEFVDTRNAIAHRRCVGMTHTDCERLIFTSSKHIRKDVGRFEVLAIDVEQLKAATSFANEAVEKILKISEPQEEAATRQRERNAQFRAEWEALHPLQSQSDT